MHYNINMEAFGIWPNFQPRAALSCMLCLSKSSFINLFVPGDILKVVDHYENPRNVGSLDKNAKNVGTGLVGAPACGDVMKLQVCWTWSAHCCVCVCEGARDHQSLLYFQIQVDENGKIVDARFKTFGCGSAIASSSLATEWVKGKSVRLGVCVFVFRVWNVSRLTACAVFSLLDWWSSDDQKHRDRQGTVSPTGEASLL